MVTLVLSKNTKKYFTSTVIERCCCFLSNECEKKIDVVEYLRKLLADVTE